MGEFRDFRQELKRRRVYRAATIYLVVAWGATEIVTFLLERLLFPAWVISLIAILFVVGFPVSMILAWHFDITTDGIQPTPPTSAKGALTIALSFVLLLGGTTGLFFLIYPDGTTLATDGVVQDEFSPPERSIAVLPFVDLSRQGDQEYLASGLAETLLNQLAKLENIHVIARTSSFVFKNQNQSIGTIGRRLNVGTVLQGSVQKQGGMIRVTTQLIDTRDESHVWSKTFDRPNKDIFGIQDEIASKVTSMLRSTLADSGAMSSAKRYTSNVAAYDLYLLGRHYWHQRTEGALFRSIELFDEATELDPDFALAHAAIADAYGVLPDYSGMQFEDISEPMEEALAKAFMLDADLAQAHASMGLLRLKEGRIEESDRSFERAISLAPGYAMAYLWYGQSLMQQSRFRDAIQTLQVARRLDPLSSVVNSNLGNAYSWTGQFDKARREYERSVELSPDSINGYWGLAALSRTVGDFDQSIRHQQKVVALLPDNVLQLRELAWAFVGLGIDDEADRLLRRAEAIDADNMFTEFGRKLYFLETGQAEAFVEYTQRNLERQPDNPFLIADAALAKVQAHDFTEAVRLYERVEWREVALDEPLFDRWSFMYGYSHALALIKAYQMNGDLEKANNLLSDFDAFLGQYSEQGVALPNGFYLLACLNALRGLNDQAIAALQRAYDAGWRGYRLAINNPVLKSLERDTRYQAILLRIESEVAEMRRRFEESAQSRRRCNSTWSFDSIENQTTICLREIAATWGSTTNATFRLNQVAREPKS